MSEPNKTLDERLGALDGELDRFERSQAKPVQPRPTVPPLARQLGKGERIARRTLLWVISGWSALVCLLMLVTAEDLSLWNAIFSIAFFALAAAAMYGMILYQWALATQVWRWIRRGKAGEP